MAAPCAEVKFLHFPASDAPVFCVDGFQFADASVTEHYFLSHFHSDHTVGLSKGFAEGLIYCSPITARLVKEFIQVDSDRIRTLPLDEPTEVAGVRVTLVDANHCPGAVVFLFHHLATGHTAVHTGDVRAAECVRAGLQKQLRGQGLGAVHELFLDTTYAATRWELPPQPEVLRRLGDLCRQEAKQNPRMLFVVGSYQIGKERAAAAIGRAVGSSVWVATRRFRMLEACDWAEEKLDGPSSKMLFTTDSVGCNVRMDNMMGLSHDRLLSALEHAKGGFDTICAFRPTGWTFSKSWQRFRPWVENEGRTKVFSVPYSEHSSVSELRELVAVLRPKKVIPTVNVERTQRMIDLFASGMDLSEDRERLDWYLSAGSRPSPGQPQLVDVLKLSEGCCVSPCGGRQPAAGPAEGGNPAGGVAETSIAAIVLSDDDGDAGRGGRAEPTTPAPAGAGVSGSSALEDLTCVDIAAQERLLSFYAREVAARQGPKRKQEVPNTPAKLAKPARQKGAAKQAAKQPAKREAEAPTKPAPRTRRRRSSAGGPAAGGTEEPPSAGAGGQGEEAARGRRFIPRPSAQVRERIDRAFQHRLYLLAARPSREGREEAPSAELDVLGSTGNVYTVTLGHPCQSCTCVDHAKQPNRVCKHILFVMLRVCKLERNDPRVWQAALTPSEAMPLVQNLPSREELASQGDGVLASGPVLRGFDQARGEAKAVRQRPIADDPDCPICFEPLAEGEGGGAAAEAAAAVAWCRSCGRNAHRGCIQRWHAARGGNCPLCRGPWEAPAPAGPTEPLNLASLAGAPAPTLEELYPETHRWIGFRRRDAGGDPAGGPPARGGAGAGAWAEERVPLRPGRAAGSRSCSPGPRGGQRAARLPGRLDSRSRGRGAAAAGRGAVRARGPAAQRGGAAPALVQGGGRRLLRGGRLACGPSRWSRPKGLPRVGCGEAGRRR
uniref:DNA cross-link repair 1A n=1 Tax=Lingulaulax polyedra TaxID=160621 RepID=A0A516AGC7_LINPO|nr:DNA cross-link repair 1A [Lingulodinium polyedra]